MRIYICSRCGYWWDWLGQPVGEMPPERAQVARGATNGPSVAPAPAPPPKASQSGTEAP